MNLYDLLAEPIGTPDDAARDDAAGTGRPTGPVRPTRPGSTYTAQIETTDERMINLRHTVAGP